MTRTEMRKLIGDPKQVQKELGEFRKAAGLFSSSKAKLIAHYPNQWVAVQDEIVVVNARTLPALIKKLKQKNIPKETVMVRYIEKNLRTFIL